MDPCIMRGVVRNQIFLLLIYVDDIVIFADEVGLKCIESFCKEEFTWITINVGNIVSYLGMQIMLEQGVVTVGMTYYLKKVLK
jgi:hypothetical protein